MIDSLFETITPLHWYAFAFLFLGLETVIPGFFLVWFGAAAFVVGALLNIFPFPVTVQLVMWALLSLASVGFWRVFQGKKRDFDDSDGYELNQRGKQYIANVYDVIDDTQHGYGKIKIGDSLWKVKLDKDYKQGESIVIFDSDGAILIGEQATKENIEKAERSKIEPEDKDKAE